MKIFKLNDMKRGWFVGDFEPTALSTTQCEVAIKHYQAGDYETAHYHKVATELTVIISGDVELSGKPYHSGDIILIEPGDVTDFKAITDVITAVVKVPSVKEDKYT